MARFALLLRAIVSAAALGPMGFGGWNALNLLLDYGSYASFGVLQGLDLELPPVTARGDPERARRMMAGAWSLVALGGAAFSAGTLLYLAGGHRRIEVVWGWGAPALMLVAALLQLAIQYHASALRAHGVFRPVSGALGAQAVLGGGLGIALVWRFGVWGLLWGWLAGGVAALLWMRRDPVRPPIGPGAFGDGLALARVGLPIFGFFAASLVLRSVDRIAFVRYAGTEGLGHYSLGLMAAGLILYLPESAATVLYPRMSAAAHGSRDPQQTRAEVRQTHGALGVVLPLAVSLGMVWAGPVVVRVLPAFREGVPALRILALGALMLSGATLPGYFLLASGHRARLLALGWGAALFAAVLVFAVASRDHRPTSIAAAAAAGYSVFALGLVALASRELCPTASDRVRFAGASFVPALWGSGLALSLCAVGPSDSTGAACLRSVAVAFAYLPVLWWFGRGLGLRALAHEWLTGRVAPA